MAAPIGVQESVAAPILAKESVAALIWGKGSVATPIGENKVASTLIWGIYRIWRVRAELHLGSAEDDAGGGKMLVGVGLGCGGLC